MTRNHIALSRDYQRLVVVPATANFLASAATGGARNGVELMLIAMPTPSVIVPAMNGVMWSKPAIQRNILALKEDGHTVLAPQEREVYEAASKDFRSGVAASTPYEVANVVREISVLPPEVGRQSIIKSEFYNEFVSGFYENYLK